MIKPFLIVCLIEHCFILFNNFLKRLLYYQLTYKFNYLINLLSLVSDEIKPILLKIKIQHF